MDPVSESARAPRPGWALLLAAAALLLGCPREDASAPDAVGEPAPVGTPFETPPSADEALTPFHDIDLPPFEPLPVPPPELPPLELTPAPMELPPVSATEEEPRQAEEPSQAVPVAALEDLLRIPAGTAPRADGTGGDSIDIDTPPTESGKASTPERSTLDRLRDSVHLESRSEPIGPKGPRQGKRSETDAGIRVPLDDAVSVEGGVRVDRREDPGLPEAERKSTPRVGVEVKF